MNKDGSILIITLLTVTVISALSVTALSIAIINIRISSAFEAEKRLFYSAEAGIEHARDILRDKASKSSFSSLLAKYAGRDRRIDPFAVNSDDIPLVDTDFTYGHYSVFLMNDVIDGIKNLTDTNNRVLLHSVAKLPSGPSVALEAQVERYSAFDFKDVLGTISMLGRGAVFNGNRSSRKLFSGNDAAGCGNMSVPVFSVSEDESYNNISKEISLSLPSTFTTYDIRGNVHKLSSMDLALIQRTASVDLDKVKGLKVIESIISKASDITIKNNASSKAIKMGTPAIPMIITAEKDFVLESGGNGVLLVKGRLTIVGDVKYRGIIMVIGKGDVKIISGGDIDILGIMMLANIQSPLSGKDGKPFTDDDELGKSLFDISSAYGSLSIQHCSRESDKAIALLPLRVVSFCDEACVLNRT